MPEPRRDPREVITPDAFSVAPELLGTPLARPWRRGVAMGLDLLLIAIFSSLAGWFLLGLGASFLLFRLARRPAGGAVRRGSRWLAFGTAGALILLVTLAYGWEKWFAGDDGLLEMGAPQVLLERSLGDAGGAVGDLITMTSAETEEELRESAISFGERLRRQGSSDRDIQDALEEIAESVQKPWARSAIDEALMVLMTGRALELDEPAGADSLAIAYAAALESDDTLAANYLREPLLEAIGADRLADLRRRNEELGQRNAELEQELEGERERGLVNLILKVANEVGIEFGWAALYFTFFPVVWRGRTPGKRLMRVRIVRLDGKPLGWWAALNRFGGYAASIFTGLIGFFEMFWDDNRQALQDRIAATVVVRELRGKA
jgi:uncharacterized RDD family membrane protein YckC